MPAALNRPESLAAPRSGGAYVALCLVKYPADVRGTHVETIQALANPRLAACLSCFGQQGGQENKRGGKANFEGGIHHETFSRPHPNGAASATGSHAPKPGNALKPEEIGDTCVDNDQRSADNPAIPNYLFPILETATPHCLLPSYLERISHYSLQA